MKFKKKKKGTKKEVSVEAQKRGKRSKNKGATYERKVADIFKTILDINLTRTPQSGGFAKKTNKATEFKGDIVCLEEDKKFILHIECKNQKSVSMRKWLQQAEGDCPVDKIPVVVFYLGQQIKDGHVKEEAMGDYVTLKLNDFLALCKGKQVIEEVKE